MVCCDAGARPPAACARAIGRRIACRRRCGIRRQGLAAPFSDP